MKDTSFHPSIIQPSILQWVWSRSSSWSICRRISQFFLKRLQQRRRAARLPRGWPALFILSAGSHAATSSELSVHRSLNDGNLGPGSNAHRSGCEGAEPQRRLWVAQESPKKRLLSPVSAGQKPSFGFRSSLNSGRRASGGGRTPHPRSSRGRSVYFRLCFGHRAR